jgi:hypothetical protein
MGNKKKSLYSTVKALIDGLEIGQSTSVAIPGNLPSFRKYLSEVSKAQHKKFTTKTIDNRLHILRIEYYSIPKILSENQQ